MICVFKRYQLYSNKGNHTLSLPMKVKFELLRINQQRRETFFFNVRNQMKTHQMRRKKSGR